MVHLEIKLEIVLLQKDTPQTNPKCLTSHDGPQQQPWIWEAPTECALSSQDHQNYVGLHPLFVLYNIKPRTQSYWEDIGNK